MKDPRDGLQQRYTLDEILERLGGKTRIKPLNYDGLRIIRDPLYVKMGQELSDNSQDQNKKILAEMERVNGTRALALETGVPLAQLEELLKRLLSQAPATDPYMDVDKDKGDDDDEGGGGGGGGGPPGPPGPPPPGPDDRGGHGPSGGGGPEGDHPAPQYQPGTLGPFMTQESLNRGDAMPKEKHRDRDRRRRRGDGPSPPPPPPSAAMAPNSSLYRSNLEIQAQLHELRQELQKQQRNENIIREMRQGITNTNPVKEIIKEFHQVMYPTPVPVPVQNNDNAQLIATLQQAMAQNQDLGKIAQQMGMSMTQLVEFMRGQKKQDDIPASSSTQPRPPPPPPPPPPLKRQDERSRSKPSEQTEIVPVAMNQPGRSRSRSAAEIPVRDPSLASTTDYRSQSAPKKNVPPPRAASVATTVDYRSRSRGDQPQITLPISEEAKPRGRDTTSRADKVLQQMMSSQNKELVKGQMRHQLGRFASSLARQQRDKKETQRAATVAPQKPTRSFDDIVELTAQDVPFGAAVQKQRVSSLGDTRTRFRGQLVR